MRHDLHESDRSFAAHGPGTCVTLDEENRRDQEGIETMTSATSEYGFDHTVPFLHGERRVPIPKMGHECMDARGSAKQEPEPSILLMTACSSIHAMTLSGPLQRGHVSMSMLNTCLSRWA